jgi:hypothetical protein
MQAFYARWDVADDREPTTDAGWYPDLVFSANSWGALAFFAVKVFLVFPEAEQRDFNRQGREEMLPRTQRSSITQMGPYATQSCALTFSRSKRNQDEQFASGAIGSLIGKPVRVRHGPATVIVEGWPECH